MELWTTPTIAQLEGIMSETERTLASTADSSVSLPDRAVPIIANLIAKIRTMITTWSPNTVSAVVTKIPPGFMDDFLIVARHRVMASIQGFDKSEERDAEYKAAEAFFDKVARGIIRPQPATDAVANDVPSEKVSRVEIVSGPGGRTGRARMDGI